MVLTRSYAPNNVNPPEGGRGGGGGEESAGLKKEKKSTNFGQFPEGGEGQVPQL